LPKIFDRVRARDASVLRKIVPVSGDLGLPGLGIEATTRDQLVNNVSVVFHAAATVKFNEPFKTAVQQNLAGTAAVVGLCKEMKKLSVRVRHAGDTPSSSTRTYKNILLCEGKKIT
jgi:fatty acyl-CoA reductase